MNRPNLNMAARLIALIFAISLLSSTCALAYWPKDGKLVSTLYNTGYARVISDGLGGVIISWMVYGEYETDVYAQRVDSTGAPQWGTEGVAVCTAQCDQFAPRLVSDGAGGAIITWQDLRNSPLCATNDIYAQRVTVNGATPWGTDGVPVCLAFADQTSPDITSDGAGGAIIAWTDYRDSYPNNHIYAQRISAQGAAVWAQDGVVVCPSNEQPEQRTPRICSDGAGGAIIIWTDNRPSNFLDDIFAGHLDSQGNRTWDPWGVPICVAITGQDSPDIVPDGVGGAIITWSDSRNDLPYEPYDHDIYAQHVNATGDSLWAWNGVPVCTAWNDQTLPRITSDGAGGAVITWQDHRTYVDDIYAQHVNVSGQRTWTPDNGVAVCTAANTQQAPAICGVGLGETVIAWTDHRNGVDIYAQRLNALGVAKWITDGLAVCTAGNTQHLAGIASDGAGGVITAWQDGLNVQMYAARVWAEGSTVGYGTPVGGAISGSVAWSGVKVASSDVTVGAGTSLTLSPGCLVRFAANEDYGGGGSIPSKCELIVQGTLTADATSQSPVTLTSASDMPGIYDWYGVRVLSGSSPFAPVHCNFEYAAYPISSAGSIHVDYCSLSHFGGLYGIYGSNQVTVEDSYIDMSGSQVGVKILSNTTATLNRNTIVGNGSGQAVAGSSGSTLTLSYNVISGVAIGLYVDNATANTSHDKISDFSQYGIQALASAMTVDRDTMLVGATGVAGIDLESCTNSSVSYAYITGSGITNTCGIETRGDASPMIEHCIISGTYRGILCSDAAAPAISRDSIATKVGVLCTDFASPTIRYTTISGVGGATGVAVMDDANPDIGYSGDPGNNRFCPSTGFSYYVASTTQTTIMAEQNWWGASKPSSRKFIGGVDYNPYLSSDPGPAYTLPLLPLVARLPKAPFVTQCYPNPSNPQTMIEYGVSEPASRVRIAIYDISGRVVRLLVDDVRSAGYYSVVWDGRSEVGEVVASGVYFYEVAVGNLKETKKLVVLR